jgi:NADH-quinone oxidoreductase subunit N
MAGNLMTVFLGIETMSIATYVLTASRRGSRRSAEAAMKYFLMGAFATAFLLYGIALTYGATGTTDLTKIRAFLDAQGPSPMLVISVFFFVIGFGFKIAAVPFHMWAPDVYDGAPTPVTGFMAAAVKAAAFAGILRVFGEAFGGDIMPIGRSGWAGISAALAAITMTVGNVAALRQRSIKRMLAYSSISHAGVILVGVCAMGLGAYSAAQKAVVFYLAAYSVTTLGAFGMLAWIGSKAHERTLVDDSAGLAQQHPIAALAMTLFMLSFGGLPPTAGFLGKFLVFKAAMSAYDQQLVWLVVVGVLNSMVSIFYYLRLVTAMYFREPLGPFSPNRAWSLRVAMALCVVLVLQMGILPTLWLFSL